jgi:glycosyltransferase involved in cell wall biosynthesis
MKYGTTTTESAFAGPQTKQLVSIVLPCYRGDRFLRDAIESCRRQTYRLIEVIVVDDASPDSSAEIAAAYAALDKRIRLVRRIGNGGVSRAFNSGFSVARGTYFTRLAQDDVFCDDAIEVMVNYLEANPHLGLAYCDAKTIDSAGSVTGISRAAEPNEALWPDNKVGLCVMWRRSVYEEIGGFDPRFDAAEDYEYWLRLSKKAAIGRCACDPMLLFRIHDEMGSVKFRAQQELAAKRAMALHCGNRRLARRLRSDGHFGAGYCHRQSGSLSAALSQLLMAVWYNPLSLRNYRCLAGLALQVARLR